MKQFYSHVNKDSNVLRVGGDEVNNAIVAYLRKKYNLLAGEREAEDIKIKIGTAYKPRAELEYDAQGLDGAEGRKRGVGVVLNELDYLSKVKKS